MPVNPSYETAKVAAALGLEEMWDVIVPVEQGSEWARFSKHIEIVSKVHSGGLTVRDILKRGHLAPLTKELVLQVGILYPLVHFVLNRHRSIKCSGPPVKPRSKSSLRTNGQ